MASAATTTSAAWSPELIVLSYLISVIGSFTSVLTMEIRRRFFLYDKNEWLYRQGLLVVSAVSLGGAGVWCMHFTGMAALQINSIGPAGIIQKNAVVICYSIDKTIASLVAPIVFTYIGLIVASMDKYDEVSDVAREEHLVEVMKANIALKDLVQSNVTLRHKLKLLAVPLFQDAKYICAGGFCTGVGVILMHFLGMMAMNVGMSWNIPVFIATCVIAIIVPTIAFWIMFRLLLIYSRHQILRLICSLVMGLAICGTHYTGMYAADYSVEDSASCDEGQLNNDVGPKAAVVSALAWCFFIIVLVIIPLIYDRAEIIPTNRQGSSKKASKKKVNTRSAHVSNISAAMSAASVHPAAEIDAGESDIEEGLMTPQQSSSTPKHSLTGFTAATQS